MRYTRITLELIVLAEAADEVTADLNTTLDTLDQVHTVFGGTIETTPFDHQHTPSRSALRHTTNASQTAINAARKGLTKALRAVI